MAWVPLDRSVFTHRKTMALAELLDMRELYAVSHLSALWTWAMDNAPKGNLAGVSDRMIARAAEWDGDAKVFVSALLASGFLAEEDGVRVIPNWMEYGGKMIAQKEKDTDRKRQERAQTVETVSAGCPPDVRRTSDVDKKRREEKRLDKTPPYREEEEDARETSPLPAEAQAGAIFPPEAPLPVMAMDFIASKGAEAERWERELRIELLGKPLSGQPSAYIMAILRGWERTGGPPKAREAPPGGYAKSTPRTRFEASQKRHAQRLQEDLAALAALSNPAALSKAAGGPH